MIRNYLKIAWRNLGQKQGIFFHKYRWLSRRHGRIYADRPVDMDELSFNKYHQHYDRIAQVMQNKTFNGTINTGVATSLPVEEALRRNYGNDFKHMAVTFWTGDHVLTAGDKKISFPGTFATVNIPGIFTLKMLKGSRNGLKGPSGIMISASTAKALFGDDEPMGKTIQFDNDASLVVSGVYQDLPGNTTLHGLAFLAPWDYFVASHNWLKRAATEWGEDSFQVFVQVADNADITALSKKIKNIELKNGGPVEAKRGPNCSCSQ